MYTVENLYDARIRIENNKVIDYFVESSYPNDYFLQHLHAPYPEPFCHKKYWESFAQILVKRGLPKINDVKQVILIWLQDTNWPGCKTIIKFVNENKQAFKKEIINACVQAYSDKDSIWLKNLLIEFYGDIPLVQEVVLYLKDDCWKEFDRLYGIDNLAELISAN